MQARPQQSKQESSHHELSMQLLNADQNEISSTEEHNSLRNEFKRLPYQFYKFWLVLSFIITAKAEYYLMDNVSIFFTGSLPFGIVIQSGVIMMIISSIFSLYGYIEIIFAMMTRSSKAAQKAFLKLQYCVITLTVVFSLIFGTAPNPDLLLLFILDKLSDIDFLLAALSLTIIPISHLIGGYIVVKAFERNNPLTRQNDNSDLMQKSINTRDFLEQNEAIVSEVLKYDRQLKRWPYLIYKFFLKLVVPIETFRLCFHILQTIEVVSRLGFEFWFVSTMTLLSFSSLLSAFCCFEIGVAMGEKILVKVKRVIFVLKIGIIESIIVFFFLAKELGLFTRDADVIVRVKTIFINLGDCVLIPIVMMIGAVKVKKILEERDQFVRVSSYSESHQL